MSTESPNQASPPRPSTDRRTSSLVGGLIRRSKSTDILGERRSSVSRTRKKLSESEQEESLRRQKVQSSAPKLPGVPQQPQIQTFGGEDYHPRSATTKMADAPPVPPIPAGLGNGAIDPYARTESMTHRGRYSYAHSTSSTLNSPRRVRRRKDPTPYNVLIIGARNSGKTSFLNFLKSSLALPLRKQSPRSPEIGSPPPSAKRGQGFTQHYQEIEIEGERIGLTLWDSPGLDKGVVDLQMREMSNFVESKFDDTFLEEMKVVRAPGLRDTHIHCAFLILDPQRLDSNIQAAQQLQGGPSNGNGKVSKIVGALDEDFDIQVLKTLQYKTTIIPVISKADTVTTTHMAYLKKMVMDSFRSAGIDPLEALNFETEESDEEEQMAESDEQGTPGLAISTDDRSENVSDQPVSDQSEDHDATAEAQATANTKRPITHKREASTMSISANLLDKGYLPFSLLSPDQHSLDGTDGPIGRKFPWGFADPYNAEHCDFVKLKEACFREWRAELREASREVFYERWRTSRLHRSTLNGHTPTPAPVRKSSGGIPIILSPRAI